MTMTPEDNIVIEETADGSMTLYRKDLDEHYHSVRGALAESLHVYLGLGWRAAPLEEGRVRVFEVGFGTGLNAALTAREALGAGIPTEYISVELYPLSPAVSSLCIGRQPRELAGELRKVNDARWDADVVINDCFTLRKIEADLLTMTLPENIGAVYFDAFAPEKQPALWSPEIFRRLHRAMIPGGVLVTYCAKGAVRRMLQSVGFRVERLPGPPGGKREVLRAVKPVSS